MLAVKHRIGRGTHILLAALGVATTLAGCGPREATDPREGRDIEASTAARSAPDHTGTAPTNARTRVRPVIERLGADAFSERPAPFHRSHATIQDETRPTLVEPVTRAVFSALGLAPTAGAVRTTIAPETAALLSVGALSLRVQRIPAAMPAELFEQVASRTASKRVSTGWNVTRGSETVLSYAPAEALDDHSLYHLHLDAVEAGPAELRSRMFELPVGGTLEFAYGLTTRTDAEDFLPVRFQAWLSCDGGEPEVLIDESLGGVPNPGWRDVSHTPPAPRSPTPRTSSCQLRLAATNSSGAAPPGAVFSVPQVVGPADTATAAQPNLIVISLDTLRADHLSGYGYPRLTTPRIDAELIAKGTVFADVTSTYSRTDVSHMSIFSGLYGEARPNPRHLAAATPLPLLAERLRAANFETAAFTEDGLIAGSFGFRFGFDRFDEFTYEQVQHGASTFEIARRYLREHKDRRFFAFIHTYKAHSPYASAPAYQDLFSDEADWLRPEMQRGIKPEGRATANAYDRAVREADDWVGDLLEELTELGLDDRTLVVLLSDHGEGLTEHGPPGHSYSAFQEVLRVPLVMRGPGIAAGQRVTTPVSLVDVTPTLLDLLDLAPLEASQGVSLLPALRGNLLPGQRTLFFSWLGENALGFRQGNWKYRRGNRKALYNLADDPGERHRLPGSAFRIADHVLTRHLEASAALRDHFIATTSEAETTSELPSVMDEDMENSLRALGYIE